MNNKSPISAIIAQLQNLSDPEKAKALIDQFSAGLKENGIEIPEAVYEMPEEMDRILNDPQLTVKVGERMETLAIKMQKDPESIHQHMNTMFEEMTENIDDLDPSVTDGTYENAKANASKHIQAALKNIQIGRKK